LGVLSKIGCGDLSKHWKSVENDTESMHTLCTLSKFREGHFRGFQDFNLESGKISEKGVFDVFGKNFHFCVLPAGGRRPLHGAKIWTSLFFEKCGTRFRFWVRFVLLYSRKSVRTKMTTPTDYYRPCCAGVSFPYAFCSDSGCEMASKKSERFCSTIIGYGEESM
jgi:hypothetical protein